MKKIFDIASFCDAMEYALANFVITIIMIIIFWSDFQCFSFFEEK